MDIKEARRIVSACIDTKYSLMRIPGYDQYVPLPPVSLETMLAANRLVAESGVEYTQGGGTIYMHIDPRGVAAMYAREHYQHDPHAVLEAMGWNLTSD